MYPTQVPNMKKIIFAISTFAFIGLSTGGALAACGAGYILESHAKIDNINAAECQKLWCMDLETGKTMGKGNAASSGYKSTPSPSELCDATGSCVECFGDRKWCAGEPAGVWNAEYGAYTRSGADATTYVSYQKGSCFAWRLEKPDCENGQTAVLKNGEWHCTTAAGTDVGSRASSIRRTGAIRRRLP